MVGEKVNWCDFYGAELVIFFTVEYAFMFDLEFYVWEIICGYFFKNLKLCVYKGIYCSTVGICNILEVIYVFIFRGSVEGVTVRAYGILRGLE